MYYMWFSFYPCPSDFRRFFSFLDFSPHEGCERAAKRRARVASRNKEKSRKTSVTREFSFMLALCSHVMCHPSFLALVLYIDIKINIIRFSLRFQRHFDPFIWELLVPFWQESMFSSRVKKSWMWYHLCWHLSDRSKSSGPGCSKAG